MADLSSSGTPPSVAFARDILQRLGEAGQPPDRGVELVNVGNERTLRVLDEAYLAPIAETGQGSAFKLVQAHYGGGKTHFLLCVRERAWRRDFAVALVGLSPHDCPFDDPLKVWQAVAREVALRPDDAEAPPIRGIEALLERVLAPRLKQEGPSLHRALGQTLRRASSDMPALGVAIRVWLKAVDEGDLDREQLAMAWLRGASVTIQEVRPLGIRELPARHNGLRLLRAFAEVLRALEVSGLLLCFDELDRNLSLTARRRRAVADNLRQLVDLCGRGSLPGLVCLYAVPPEFMRSVVAEYPALQQRLEAPAPLSRRSPQSAVIDLERSELPPEVVLQRIGDRILQLFSRAHGVRFDQRLQKANLEVLAREITSASFDTAHRRAFVKAAVDLFFRQREDQCALDVEQVRELAGEGGQLLVFPGRQAAAPDPFDDF